VSVSTSSMVSLTGHDPATYRPHSLHGSDRAYMETNCYSDILIEMLHARGLEPLAAMGFTVAMDFEGDQWTFFKPPPEDLERLFAVDIHEMQPYRALPEQIEEQLGRDRTMIVELDAWYLPDTASTSYRSAHVKTSVVMEGIDRDARRLRYFHNASLHELAQEDYDGVFRIGLDLPGDVLPPYAELVRFDAGEPLAGEELREAARGLLRHHLGRRPSTNPFERFGADLRVELPLLLEADPQRYHDYVFATLRMAGSGFEVCASHVDWVLGEEGREAVAAMNRIVESSKLLSLKLARRRAFDPTEVVDGLAGAWQDATDALAATLG
jgi:hypothetical protein